MAIGSRRLAGKRQVSVTFVLIQSQLRGIGRFGYRVSKENFLFFALDIPSMSNPGGSGVFRFAQRRFPRPRAAQKAQRFNGLAGMRPSVPLHKEIRSSYTLPGFSRAICATGARHSSAL